MSSNKKQNLEILIISPAARPCLPWLLLLFVGSGCAALIYEVVWLQLLQLVIDSSGISLSVLLGIFMETEILNSILKYYKFPEDVFIGSSEGIEKMKLALFTADRVP